MEEELEQVRKVRSVQRERRMKNSVPVVAIVGYTNAGKSTLLNQLTGAGIPANNRLFDTLDTTSRLLTVSDNLDVILSDTVGFIAKLPHHLVDAFRATLEELEFADLLLHVSDASDPHLEEHIAVIDRLISQLDKPETPVLKCYNKADLVYSDDIPVGKNIVAISAKRGINMDGLLKAIESALNHAGTISWCVCPLPWAAWWRRCMTVHRSKKWTTPRRASRSRPSWTESSTADSGNISSGSAEDWTSI